MHAFNLFCPFSCYLFAVDPLSLSLFIGNRVPVIMSQSRWGTTAPTATAPAPAPAPARTATTPATQGREGRGERSQNESGGDDGPGRIDLDITTSGTSRGE